MKLLQGSIKIREVYLLDETFPMPFWKELQFPSGAQAFYVHVATSNLANPIRLYNFDWKVGYQHIFLALIKLFQLVKEKGEIGKEREREKEWFSMTKKSLNILNKVFFAKWSFHVVLLIYFSSMIESPNHFLKAPRNLICSTLPHLCQEMMKMTLWCKSFNSRTCKKLQLLLQVHSFGFCWRNTSFDGNKKYCRVANKLF